MDVFVTNRYVYKMVTTIGQTLHVTTFIENI